MISKLELVVGLCRLARPGGAGSGVASVTATALIAALLLTEKAARSPGPEIRGVRPGRRYGFANVDTFGIVIAWLIVTAMIVTSAALFWISQR